MLFKVPALPNAVSFHSVKSSDTVDFVFQGSPSEIEFGSFAVSSNSNDHDTASAMSAKTPNGASSQASIPSNPPTGSSAPQQQAPSDSRLTEMLNGISISPSKTTDPRDPSWRESATVPPLMVPNGQGPMIAGPPASLAYTNLTKFPQTCMGVLSDGTHILDRIEELKHRIDIPGKISWDNRDVLVAATGDAAEQVKAKLDELTALMEKRFDSTKTDLLNSIKSTNARVVDQNNSIHTELEKLYNYIKSDIADVLAKQAKKTGDLENTVKALQTTVHDLQKTVDRQAQAQSQYLPNYFSGSKNMYPHSQPNFGYDAAAANTDVGRDMGQRAMPPIADSNSNGRYAYNGYGNGNNGSHGQPWYPQGRPATARDSAGKAENYAGAPNSYYNPEVLQARSGNTGGGYAANGGYGYYSGGPNENSYTYGQSGK